MLAIFKKEFKAYFCNFIGWIFVAVTMFFLGLYFTIYNAQNGMPYVSYTLSSCVFVYLISIPVLTMRSIAEEKKSKTDQLLMTVPVSLGKIVIGKYLSLVAILAIPVGVFCFAPVLMNRFGSVPFGMAYLSILGFFLFGTTAIAIGVFISSLTENQVIAAVLSFAALFLCYVMPGLSKLVSQTGNWFSRFLMCFNLTTPFENLLSGTLSLTSIIYFLSVTALMLFLTTQVMQKKRYTVSKNTFSLGAYSTVSVIFAIAVTVVLNMVVSSLPSTYTTMDITSEKLYSITDETKQYLKTLDEDIVIYVLSPENGGDDKVSKMLKYYCAENEHIGVKYVDPSINPKFASKFTDKILSTNSLIITSERRAFAVDYSDLYKYSYTQDQMTGEMKKTAVGYDGEGQVTNGIDYVVRADFPVIYMTAGHNESELDENFRADLEKSNYQIKDLSLLTINEIPKDASCVMIYAPTSDFSKDDVEKIEAYIDRGGKVVYVVGLSLAEQPTLNTLLEYMGARMVPGFLLEPNNSNNYQGNAYNILPELISTKYTRSVYESKKNYIITPYSRGIKRLDDEAKKEEIEYTAFIRTTKDAFAKVEVGNGDNFDKGPDDETGIFAIGAEMKKYLDNDETGTLIYFGSSIMFSQAANETVSGNNEKIFTATMAEFCGIENNIVISVKPFEASYLAMNTDTIIILAVLTIVLVPLSCLILGLVIWLRRRTR